MSTELKWVAIEVPSHGPMYRVVVDEDGYTVCPPMMRSDAERIVRDHNSHDTLVKALDALQRNPNDPRAHRAAFDALKTVGAA